MILPELTPAVARALQTAQALAQTHGADQVQPAHLLHALLEEAEGHAALLLTQAGLVPSLIQPLPSEPPAATANSAQEPPLPLSRLVEDALHTARSLASDLGEESALASPHLLLALLHRDEGLRHQLVQRGLDFAKLETAMATRLPPSLQLDEPLVLTETTEHFDAARILDANANRAREALRVLEDYARFVLEDRFLSGQLKQLRHDLTSQLLLLPARLLLEARETLRDVGTTITNRTEQQRPSLLAVAQANGKRLQEALRSLEEYGKVDHPEFAAALEGLRYQSYTLERALLLGTSARERLAEARLYLLATASQCTAGLDWTIQEAAAGGVQVVQLREKGLSDRELLERARRVRRWTRQANVLFILNDRPDLARLAEADGVHLGQEDLSVKDARRIVGAEALIGVSTHNLAQLRQALLDGASYVGVGPTFPSGTKSFAEFAGLEFVREATAETSLPIFVIGGVNTQTLPAALSAGARRVAVSQAICQAEDPRAAAAELRRLLDEARPSNG